MQQRDGPTAAFCHEACPCEHFGCQLDLVHRREYASRAVGRRNRDGENGDGRNSHEPLRGAAQPLPLRLREPVRADHDQVCTPLFGRLTDNPRRSVTAGTHGDGRYRQIECQGTQPLLRQLHHRRQALLVRFRKRHHLVRHGVVHGVHQQQFSVRRQRTSHPGSCCPGWLGEIHADRNSLQHRRGYGAHYTASPGATPAASSTTGSSIAKRNRAAVPPVSRSSFSAAAPDGTSTAAPWSMASRTRSSATSSCWRMNSGVTRSRSTAFARKPRCMAGILTAARAWPVPRLSSPATMSLPIEPRSSEAASFAARTIWASVESWCNVSDSSARPASLRPSASNAWCAHSDAPPIST